MESGTDGASRKGALIPVPESSDDFRNNILVPLLSAHLYDESKQCFTYKSAVLIQNPNLEEKYNALRAKKRGMGYSEEDLKEIYGFLLFEDVNKAKELGETGVLNGNSTCSTLGDPAKGVYLSMYSDCVDLHRWPHEKSGYIAIIRLTQGRVQTVSENFTPNLSAPTEGFDCHMSDQLLSVSSKNSSFGAFERTQFYIYELLDDGSGETAPSPSFACPFAIVSFSYKDSKATLLARQEQRVEKKWSYDYLPWRGQLEIGTQIYDVVLKSAVGALTPAKLPPVVKVDQVISMSDLKQLLPKAVFESCFSGEVSVDGLFYILCKFVSSVEGETSSLPVLLQEIKEKDFAPIILLNDGGFLILLHPSHFLTYDATESADILQGMFVFPNSRVIKRDVKSGQRQTCASTSSEILHIVPVLSYAETKVEKTNFGPTEELCDVLAHHMKSYAALINPGPASSPSLELATSPEQYDVPDAHKHIYSSSDWTKRVLKNFKLYLGNPLSFQLSVSKASEILAAGKEEQREVLDNGVNICPSSPEEVQASPFSKGLEDQPVSQKPPVDIELSTDSCLVNAEAEVESTVAPKNVAPNDQQVRDTDKSDPIEVDDMGVRDPPTSEDLPAELIVSITSEQTVSDKRVCAISTVSTIKHNDLQLSSSATVNSPVAGVNCLTDENVKTIKVPDCPKVINATNKKRRKRGRGRYKGPKKESTPCKTLTVQKNIPVEDNTFKCQDIQVTESSNQSHVNMSSDIDWRTQPKQRCKFRKMSSKNTEVDLAVAENTIPDLDKQTLQSSILMELDTCHLRKKTERWDLKPVVSTCGRIFVPYGSVDMARRIKSLTEKGQSTRAEPFSRNMSIDVPVIAHDTAEMELESNTNEETAVDKTEDFKSKDEGDHHFSDVNPDHTTLRWSDDGIESLNSSYEESSENNGTDASALNAVQAKPTHINSQGECTSKEDILLSKLKSILFSRGKRKRDCLFLDETGTDSSQCLKPSIKKNKDYLNSDMLNSNDGIRSIQDTSLDFSKASGVPSVDPGFVRALGLTPKETTDQVQKNEGQDTRLRTDSSETLELSIDERHQNMELPLLVSPKSGRIKTLKKHQGISTEHVRKNWWLHFQTPAYVASEKHMYKECNSTYSVWKAKTHSACPSTDALTLLADLALSASHGQVPPQPDPELERKQSSFKKCELAKDVPSTEQESVLHTLLSQAVVTPIQPLESPRPSHLIGGSELLDLVSKDHAYSLPPSSAVLLGLPGTALQVAPLSGSSRLLHCHQIFSGNQTPHPGQEDRKEHNRRTPEYVKKSVVFRRKFRHSRSFFLKGESVKVTRQWTEDYDFSLDSKFSTDAKDKAIVRALHGPWNLSIQDTNEEVRLIVHMWIGLFYSRSTPRAFHNDSNFTYPCTEDADSLEMSEGTPPASAQSKLKNNSLASSPIATDTSDGSVSNALDLTKKDISSLGQETDILDLSVRKSKAEVVTPGPPLSRKEASVCSEQRKANEILKSLESPEGSIEASTSQNCKKIVLIPDICSEVNDVRSINEKKTTSCTTLQNIGGLKHTDTPSSKGDGIQSPVREEVENVSLDSKNHWTASESEHALRGSNSEKTQRRDCCEHSEATQMSLLPKHGQDSSKSKTDKDVHKETGGEFKHGEKWAVNEGTSHKGNMEPSPKVIDDPTSNESGIVFNQNLLANFVSLAKEDSKVISPAQAENITEKEECSLECKDKNHFAEENGSGKTASLISAVEDGTDMSDQLLPAICANSDLIMEDCSAECNPEAPLEHLPPQPDRVNNACPRIALADELVTSEKAPHSPAVSCHEPAAKAPSEKDMGWVEKVGCMKATLLVSDESTHSLEGSSAEASSLQTKDPVEKGRQSKMMANFSRNDTKSIEREEKVDSRAQKEPLLYQSHFLQREITQDMESEEALTENPDFNTRITNPGLEKTHSGVLIPFIGIDISRDYTIQPHFSHSQGKVEETVSLSETPLGRKMAYPKAVLPIEAGSPSHLYNKELELSPCKISPSQSVIFGSESGNMLLSPTMDEKLDECIPLGSGSSNALAFTGHETCSNITQKYLDRSSTPLMDEILPEQRSGTVRKEPSHHHGPAADLEQRTQRVLQCLDEFLSKTGASDELRQIQTADINDSLDQTFHPRSKYIPTYLATSHMMADSKDKKINNEVPAVVAFSTSHDPPTESPDQLYFKSKSEEELCVKLDLKKKDLSVQQHYPERTDKLKEMPVEQDCCPHEPLPSVECLQAGKPQRSSEELNSYSQRPVMAVKPSRSEENQTNCILGEGHKEDSVISSLSKSKNTHTTSTSLLSKREAENVKGNSERLKRGPQEAVKLSSRRSRLSKVKCSNLKSDKDPSCQGEGRGNSFSSPSVSCSECSRNSSELADGNQKLLACSTFEEPNMEMDQAGCSDTLTSPVDSQDNSITDDSLDPHSSLICTVFNTGKKRSPSFLEQLSKRCLQEDLTQASMEQECLIFSEKMKQFLKKSKKRPISKEDAHDKLKLPCINPVTVHFSSLEEQEDSMDHLDLPTLVGQQLKVDMSDRNDLADTTEKQRMLDSQKLPQRSSSSVEPAGVSSIASECASLYTAMMNDICADKRLSSRQKDKVYSRADSSDDLDFCGQMKNRRQESCQRHLNSVVKESWKTKSRFFILQTSDDAFFEGTKALLEAEGHIPVQPSQFFSEGGSSSLLVILRNEDIAEHVCEVPHLLELKRSPGVQFAGIDEPEDVVNLTYQELFLRGGFIMLDEAALESLSLCHMKKVSEILQQLNKTGRWKWMLHYRDSRRMKENARSSAVAKENKHFMNQCQDAGLLEVLPYHECDLMSRDHPDYVTCLVRLQIQNISARYPVFVTDRRTDGDFGRSGILTMTLNSFLTNFPQETFYCLT